MSVDFQPEPVQRADLTQDPIELLRQVVKHCGVHREAASGHQLWAAVFATIASPPRSVDALVEKLDARCAKSGERWDVYRLHSDVGGWRAYAHHRHESEASDPAAVDARGETMSEALAGLLATPRLPVVPRRPPVCAGFLIVRKNGTVWDVLEDGQKIGWKRTKREATEILEPYRDGVRARYEAWLTDWGTLVEFGTEGTDFYWEK